MGSTVRLRSRGARALGVATVVAAALALVVAAFEGATSLLTYGAPVVLVGVLGWAAFWEPYVEVSDGGVTVANTLRTVEVPWPAVESVEGRYGLRLVTAYGAVTAWAAPAPAGRQRARSQPGEAAALAQARLEELREAGFLDDKRLERPRLQVTWHTRVLVALGVLVLAAVLLPFAA